MSNHTPEGVTDDSSETEAAQAWCSVCGDVKSCLHRPDRTVVAAWVQETRNGEERGRRKDG